MSGSELDEVTALVGRILPDPNGFVQRLLDQAVSRWGGAGDPAATPDGEPIEVSARTASNAGDGPAEPAGPLGEMINLLAAALGACDCWGLQPRCPVCDGAGSSGWMDPDLTLFQEFVGPAAARLSGGAFDDPVSGPPPPEDSGDAETHNPTRGNPTYRIRQGVPT